MMKMFVYSMALTVVMVLSVKAGDPAELARKIGEFVKDASGERGVNKELLLKAIEDIKDKEAFKKALEAQGVWSAEQQKEFSQHEELLKDIVKAVDPDAAELRAIVREGSVGRLEFAQKPVIKESQRLEGVGAGIAEALKRAFVTLKERVLVLFSSIKKLDLKKFLADVQESFDSLQRPVNNDKEFEQRLDQIRKIENLLADLKTDIDTSFILDNASKKELSEVVVKANIWAHLYAVEAASVFLAGQHVTGRTFPKYKNVVARVTSLLIKIKELRDVLKESTSSQTIQDLKPISDVMSVLKESIKDDVADKYSLFAEQDKELINLLNSL